MGRQPHGPRVKPSLMMARKVKHMLEPNWDRYTRTAAGDVYQPATHSQAEHRASAKHLRCHGWGGTKMSWCALVYCGKTLVWSAAGYDSEGSALSSANREAARRAGHSVYRMGSTQWVRVA